MKSDGNRHVALLRAINVGKRQIKMDLLAKMFRDAGLDDVRTLIASGNVIFTSPDDDHERLEALIESAIQKAVGFEVDVMLRSHSRFQELVKLNPFPADLDGDTNTYVTFLKRIPEAGAALPYRNLEERYSIVLVDGADVFCMASMLPTGIRGDFGKYLTKTFGKLHTTRNWNTVVKLASL